MVPITLLLSALLNAQISLAYNFAYESIQLKPSDIGENPDIAFGEAPDEGLPRCKNYPGYEGWPSASQWKALNASLAGTLIGGIPPAAACYKGEYKDAANCANIRRRQYDALYV
jgi:hypothetical protein